MHRWAMILRTLLLTLSWSPSALAWNSTGHRASCIIAWHHMTPQTRTRVSEILKAHPRYEKDLLDGMPEGFADPDLYAFASAATWPDMIRNLKHPMSRKYHKSRWHFINFIIIPQDDKTPRPDPPSEWWIPGSEPDNILQAIEQCRVRLTGEHVEAEERAMALCWYLHLLGDVHQPLHTVALWSEQFPDGDRGGNSFIVRADGSKTNLHKLWDELLGGYEPMKLIERVAERAVEDNPRYKLAQELAITDPIKWARESEQLALEASYLNCELRGATKADADADKNLRIPEVPDRYTDAARKIARKRVALAGYRMADALNALYGNK